MGLGNRACQVGCGSRSNISPKRKELGGPQHWEDCGSAVIAGVVITADSQSLTQCPELCGLSSLGQTISGDDKLIKTHFSRACRMSDTEFRALQPVLLT